MTPTDEIPFTRGMAATIADTFDALAKHVAATDVRKQAGLVPTPQPAPHPKPYTEATRWACAVSLPHTNDYRIFKGKVQFNPSIIGERWSDDNDGYTTVESLLSAEQRGEVVRVGDHVAEVGNMVEPKYDHHYGRNHGDSDRITCNGKDMASWHVADELNRLDQLTTTLKSQLAAEREACRVFANDFYQRNLKPYSREYQENVIGGITNPIARAAIEAARKEPAR